MTNKASKESGFGTGIVFNAPKESWTIQEVLSAERAAVGDKGHHTLRQLHDDMVRCGSRSVIRFDLTSSELRMLEKFSPVEPTPARGDKEAS